MHECRPPGYCGGRRPGEASHVHAATSRDPRHRRRAAGWSGRFSEPVAELRQALHRVGRLRPAAGRRRHRRLARARAHAGGGRRPLRAPTSPRSSAAWRRSRGEIERGEFAWSPRPRGRASQHRAAPDRARSAMPASGCTPARSRNDQVATDLRLWLRAAIDAHRHGDHRACAARCSIWPSAHAATIMPGFTHLQVAQPVTLRPPPARLRRDARARRRAPGRLPARASTGCRWAAAALAGTSFPIDREQRRARARLRRRCARTRSTPCRIATSRSNSPPPPRCVDDAPVALRRGARPVVEPALRLRAPRRPLLHRQLDHAAEEESRRARARARQDRPRRTATWSRCSTLMKGQPLAYNKDNQEDKEPLFDIVDTLRRHAGRSWPTLVATASTSIAERMRAAAQRGLRDRDRSCRLPGAQGPAVPRRARGRRARGARMPRPSGAIWPSCRSPTLQRCSPLIDDDVFAVLTLEGSVASRDHPGGTAPAQVRAAIRARARRFEPGTALAPAIGPHRPRLNQQGAAMESSKAGVSRAWA